MTPADVLTLRRQERDTEYEHRLMELDLACTGIAPVGADPRAPAHGVKAFVDDMRGLDFEQTARNKFDDSIRCLMTPVAAAVGCTVTFE